MNCPFCGGEMEVGLIPADRFPLKWVRIKGNQLMDNSFSAWFRHGARLHEWELGGATAWYCAACHKVIADTLPED